MCILGRVACRVGALGEFPPFVSWAAYSRGRRGTCALCPSLVGCKGQHYSVAWQVLLWLLQLHRCPLHTCVAVYMGSARVRHRMRTMACHTGLQVQHVLRCLATCLATRALPLTPSTGAHADVNTPQYVNIAQYTHTNVFALATLRVLLLVGSDLVKFQIISTHIWWVLI